MNHFPRIPAAPGVATRILAAALVVMLAGLFVSCSPFEQVSGGGPTGQHLRLSGSTFGPTTLDPALVRDAESAFLARQIFRGLVSLDQSLQPQPELASSIEVSTDGLTYSFTLHETATFHDGSPIDAQAVVDSFNRASDPSLATGHGSIPAAITFADIEGIQDRLNGASSSISGVKATGRRTLEITLQRPAVNFLSKLTGSAAAIVDAQTATGTNWWHQANGSGPFRVSAYAPGERLELSGFEEYPPGSPRLDEVTILFGSGAQQPLNLYERGRIDMTQVPGWAVDRVASPTSALHHHLVQTAQLSTTFIALNPNVDPYRDPDARQLIMHAIDREKIVEVMHDGRVRIAEGLIAPGVLDANWPAEIPPYDLAAAMDLAMEAGQMQPPPTLVEPGGGISSALATALERDVGIQLDVVDRTWPDFARRLDDRDMPGFVLTWIADYPDPENMLASLLASGSPDNYIGYSNPAFDELVREANGETDPDRRRDLYLEAQQIAIDDAIIIPLYHQVSHALIQPWVQDLVVTEIGILSLEDVWIEDEQF